MSLKDKITSSNLLLSEIESLEEERKIKSIRDVLKDSLEVLANNMSGNNAFTPTQFEDLDAIILGLDQPSYVVIGGRPGMGKTSLGMQIIENMAKQGKKSLVFSLEMPQEQLLLRMISSNARVPFTNLRKGKLTETDIAKIQLTVEKLKELPISFDDDGSNTIADIEKKAKAMKDKQGLDVVLIDYIQLLKGDNPKLFGKRNSEMEDISRRLMSMGKRLNMTVIILAQLNRNVEERIDKRPVMSDLRDTGGIEQDANLIMFCYRDEYYNKENTDKLGQAEVIIRKARNGAVGTATLRFIGEYTRFEQWIPEEDDIDYDDNPF
jgi:replicative DNA helicase